MSIEKLNIKLVRQENKSFTTLYNSVIQNITDAFALGVYCYLSSLPHDWIVSKKQLMNHFNVGKDKISSTMSWLNKNNLIEYLQERNEDGKMGSHVIIVKDGSSFDGGKAGYRKSRLPEKPVTGKSAPTNIIINTNEIKDTKEIKAQPKKQVAVVSEPIVLPDWLPNEVWEEFKQHRKQLKKPMSELAQKKSIKQLEKMRSDGQDIVEVIEASIANGWQGLFNIKSQGESHGKDSKYIGKNGRFDATQYLLDSIREDEERKLRESQEDNRLFENSLPSEDGQYLQYDGTSVFSY
jgi:hypothetical protein